MKGAIGSGIWSGADDEKDMVLIGIKEMHAKGALLQRTDGYNYYWLYPNIIEGTGAYVIKTYLNGVEITSGFTVDYNTGIFTFTNEIDETQTIGGETVTNRVTADFYYLIETASFYKYNEASDTCFTFTQVLSDVDLQYVNAGDKFYVGAFNALLASIDNGFPGKQIIYRQENENDILMSYSEKSTYNSDYKVLPLANPSFERTDGWTADSGCTFTQDAVNANFHGSYAGKLVVASAGTFKGITQTIILDTGITQAAFICLVKPTSTVSITIKATGETVNRATMSTHANKWCVLCIKTPVYSGAKTSFEVGIYPQATVANTGTVYVDHACLIQYPLGEILC